MANVDVLTNMVNAQPLKIHVVAVARRTTRYSNVNALGGGTVHQYIDPP